MDSVAVDPKREDREIKVFLSYKHPEDERFVHAVNFYLRSQPHVATFFYPEAETSEKWRRRVAEAIPGCDCYVLFLGEHLGETQEQEHDIAIKYQVKHQLRIRLPGLQEPPPPEVISRMDGRNPIIVPVQNEEHALVCALKIVQLLGRTPVRPLELPIGYPFDYEKSIIEEYVDGKGHLSQKWLDQGCPDEWPRVPKNDTHAENPIPADIIGSYRRESASIVVDCRTGWRDETPSESADAITWNLTFPEAGPREYLRYPLDGAVNLTVGIVVSGGIAPGINAVIDGIVSRHDLYRQYSQQQKRQDGTAHRYSLNIYGYGEGFRSLLRPGQAERKSLNRDSVKRVADLGGSLLGTSRPEELLDPDPAKRLQNVTDIVERLHNDNIEILYVIGGDGSMRAAHAIWKRAKETRRTISVIGIPKTTDNDILWVWQSFGFLSAVEKACEAISSLYTEVTSNPRLGIIQLFGSDSGFVVSHAALASGVCDAALIPEMEFSMRGLSAYMREKLSERREPSKGDRPYGMIVMAEAAIPRDAEEYLEDTAVGLLEKEKIAVKSFIANDRRVRGPIPDELRSAGLKIVSKVLQQDIQTMKPTDYWGRFRVFTNEPRHLLRSIRPSVSDVTFGERLGTLAVDNAMAGYTDFMVSQWQTEYVLVPLRLVILGRKRVRDGIFWKSVLASTGQPPRL